MKFKKKLQFFFLSLCLILPLSVSMVVPAFAGEMSVHFIDVGQGLAILAQSEGETLLYDGGDRAHGDQLVGYLLEQQVDTIDYMISSHYDEDHLGGLVKCLKEFPVEEILGSDYVHTSDLFNTFMNTATANALIVQYPKVGDTFSFGSGSFTVFGPAGIKESDSNSNSLVIKLENGENSFLFTGDAEETSEQDMITARLNLDCDVLSLGHHGSATSTTWDLLESATPSYAVVSCGTGNKYQHPSGETMGRLKDMNIPVFRTDKQGTLVVTSATPSYAVVSCGTGNKYQHPSGETMGRLKDMNIPVFRTDKQGTLVVTSDGTTLSWNQEPCNDYSSGDGETTAPSSPAPSQDTQTSQTVWLSATGEKYHAIPDCGRMNPDKAIAITEEEALAKGYEPCRLCWN